jgi:hypothetical protein
MIRALLKPIGMFAATFMFGMLPNSATAATVDLLVLYDTYSRNYFGGDPQTAMQSWVNQMNAAYRDSQVDIQLRLVGVRAHEETGGDMGAVLGNLRVDTNAIALRDQLGADFVSMLHQTGACGVGYMAVDRNWTWNVVGPQCGPIVMAHELGHNMGLNHSRRQGDTGGARYRYGLGYGVDNQFGTIMSYESLFNAPKVARFSNPNLRCGSASLPCGVPVGDPNEAYAALAIHNVRDEMAGFRPTVVSGGPVSLYQHCGYTGWAAGLAPGRYTLGQLQAQGFVNDDLSSLRVPSGYRVTLYEHDNFTGRSLLKTADDDCVADDGFNDIATSVVIEGGSLNGTRQLAPGHALGKRVDSQGGSSAAGNPIIQYTANGSAAQRWAFNNVGVSPAGHYNIALEGGANCVEVYGWGTANKSKVALWPCTGGANQAWNAVPVAGTGRYTLRPAHAPNKCLDVPDWSQNDFVQLEIYDCHSGTNQQWQIQ